MEMTQPENFRIAALEVGVANLTSAVGRLESLISEKISDLKDEQIAYLQKADERLADDQRRSWEAIRALEHERYKRQGGITAIQGFFTMIVGLISGSVGALVAHMWR